MRILIFTLIVCCISANKTPISKDIGLHYYPSKKQLKDGLVWKYYVHTKQPNSLSYTDITYLKIMASEKVLTIEEYDAAYEISSISEINIDKQQWKLNNQRHIRYQTIDPTADSEYPSEINQNTLIDWQKNGAVLDKITRFGTIGKRTISKQISNRDSMSAEGRSIRIIESERTIFPISQDSYTDTIHSNEIKIYEEGLGLVKQTRKTADICYEMVLDEIMTSSDFETRSKHGMHRVAYIDTLLTLDDHTLFDPCHETRRIVDYYNDELSEFKGGKGRLRAVLKDKLDTQLLDGQSGYLTYRFVVNCKGEAGWFITEEADLSFQKSSFNEKLRMRLFEILYEEKIWTHAIIRGFPRDAYTYITFKIQNGEITEILP